jgi:hypothetical protein
LESLYILIGICCGIFVLFSLGEVVTLKKEVKKLNGIVAHLLKADKSNNSQSD